ncbi:DUF2339 domain-containing protein [Luteolibacter arcticus]|uniref:DUF2339 domain-containing protein n=1 Tax=Luteolibacter arcticus TaxID=1581411 RepID=A0ABT3GEZ3_9BACT|nr:DUF2339 domain-containing protein [Luteolibacter arcticus]MCW1922041.1 DUF2339 domain-containing protein [Luteolibacter arcticus]
MTEEERDSYRRELQWLRDRVHALATQRATEIADLHEAISLLEQKLVAPVMPAVAPSPPPAEELPAPAPLPVFAEEIPAQSAEREMVPPPALGKVLPLPPPIPKGSFELRFGRIWLVRLGIALLITGLVLLGNYAYQNWIRDLSAGIRLAALYFGSFLICGTGVFLGARETMRRFGDVLLAGGLAFFYWCTFAAHHAPRLQVIDSPVLAGVLLLGAAGVIVGVSLRRDSRVTATMGLLLASYSTVLQPLGWLSAASNVVLACAGTAFMLRRGWCLPGVASMAGTYLAFLWWQIAGGHGGRPDDPAALWFLPPVWVAFALPGVIGVSRHFDGMSDRARAVFASANNIAFFLLFSALWVEQQRSIDDYWTVPAVFGAVLLALGVAGRSRDAAGGAHLAQGLSALTLAMALKLDGYHLALGFAGQTLALSFAFRRFGGKSELVFAMLAAAMALVLSLSDASSYSDTPLWSRALVATLLVAAAFPLRAGCEVVAAEQEKSHAARVATALVFLAGSVVGLVFCGHHLAVPWRAPACGAVALGWSAFTLLRDPRRRLPEAGWAALVFGLASIPLLYPTGFELPWWPPVVAGLLALASHRLWLGKDRAITPHDIAKSPEAFLWLSALTISAATFKGIEVATFSETGELIGLAAAAIGIAAVGRFLVVSPILQIGAVLLLPPVVQLQTDLTRDAAALLFVPVAAALGVIALAGPRSVAGFLARFAAGFTWLIAWNTLAPETWGEVVAASAVLLAILSIRRGQVIVYESWAFLASAVAWLLVRTSVTYPWAPMPDAPFPHGAITVAACFALPLLTTVRNAPQRTLRHVLLMASAALLALWSSQYVVWHFDWKPVAILWTSLGFALVSAGLWRKLSALRHAGFALLAVALVKLFAVDVWDFGTFIRIAAFLALGVALVVLGFFYNRFADALKKLFEADEV